MLLKQPYIGPKSIIFEVILVISVVIPVISVNRRTASERQSFTRGCGYTYDHRADKYPYPHDHRANKDSYPHDRNVTDVA